jgi:gliding motility-associated-like protein
MGNRHKPTFLLRSVLKPLQCGSLLLFAALLFPRSSASQIQVSNYTACPNMIVTVNVTWPNVAITSLSLINIPVGGSPAGPTFNLGTATTFTISYPGPNSPNWTIAGTGNSLGGPTTSTTQFNLQIVPSPPLNIANQGNYCPGSSATLVADPGGAQYAVTLNGAPINGSPFSSNVITIPGLSSANNGTYLVTSIGTCTYSGNTVINVAPQSAIQVNQPINICQNGTATLTASGNPNISPYEWVFNGSPVANTATHVISNIQTNQSGPYVVNGIYNFTAAPYAPVGCPVSATTQINVVGTNPVAVAASPGAILCQGDKLTLDANAGAIGYSWVGPASYGPVTIQSPTISPLAPNNAGVYTVTAFFTNNFLTCTTSNTIQVQVVPVTPPVITMPSSTCQNTDAHLSATAGPNAQFTWFGPGFPNQTWNQAAATIASIQPNGSGTYFVTAKYTVPPVVCAATASAQLNVVQVNSISVIPPQPVCAPGNGFLFASAIGANSYTWTGPNNFTNPGSNVMVAQAQPSMSGIYSVTASFGGGSGNITCRSSNTVELKIYPTLKFTLIPRQQTCYNSSVTVSGPAGADTYTWTSSTGFTSSNKDIFFGSIQPTNAGTYTLQVSLGPCVSGASTEIVVVTPLQFTLVPKSRTVCEGDTVLIEAGVTGGSENYAYTWNPGLYMDSPYGPKKTVIPPGSVQYNLIVHDIACPHYTVGHVFDVVVKNAPKPKLNLATERGCAPLTLLFDPQTQDTAAITTFDFGGLEQFQANDTVYTFRTAGEYTVKILSKGENGCSGVYVHPNPILVLPRPGAEVHWMPERPTTSDEITFYPTVQNDPVIFHSWLFQGGEPSEPDSVDLSPGIDTTDQWSPKRKYHRLGKYPVMLIVKNENECIDTVVKFVDVIDDLQVFVPNSFTPNGDGVNDRFGMKGQGMKAEHFVMELSDRWGNVVFSTKDINEQWDGTVGGVKMHDGVYQYRILIVGMNGEGRKQYVGHFLLLK